MESIINDIREWVLSDFAFRLYAGIGGGVVLVLSFYKAWREYRALRFVDPRDILAPETRGRLPSTMRGWARRARKDTTEVKHKFRALVYGTGRVALLGVGVPTALLVLLTLNYAWFEPGAIVVIDAYSGNPIAEPTARDAGVFVAGALAKGLLFDFVEVFQVHVSRLTNSSDNFVFSTLVLIYRAAANLFLIFVPVFLFAAWRAMKRVENEVHARAQGKRDELAARRS
tara:strand:+ start:907 stop:1590 length:684 start_codon:yes stop_codon:yes gene_type:complete